MNTRSSAPKLGARHRRFVGPAQFYDVIGASQFNLLTAMGLRASHSLLDIGCGSLRGGRLAIMYLDAARYFGIEPEQWLVEEGISQEVGKDLIELKRPTFIYRRDFELNAFGRSFDFIMAQSIFSHAAQGQIRACLSQAKRVLAKEGIFLATFMPGRSNYIGNSWFYRGCTKYKFGFFMAAAKEHDLACQAVNWTHPNGQVWIAFTHNQRTTPLPPIGDNGNPRGFKQWIRGFA